MSTTAISAGQIMDRVAQLLNDPNKTDYTYAVMIPYLNLAIEEFSDITAEANTPFTNLSNLNLDPIPIIVPTGLAYLAPPEFMDPTGGVTPHYPPDLLEIQEIGERTKGDDGPFKFLPRREFQEILPVTNSLMYWVFERGIVRFNPPGANCDIEVQVKFVYQGVPYIANENSLIYHIGSRTYLGYKTAALCAMFIGENPTRAEVLENEANKAIERTINISNKGRQQIMTRHRPFRAAYKRRSII